MLRKYVSRKVTCVLLAFTAFAADAAVKIRLQFVFDKGAMDYISQAGADYDDFAQRCVDRMNTVLTNSRLNDYFTYELACTTLLPGVDNTGPDKGYTEGWAALTGNRGEEWADMLTDRYNNAADVVVLLVNTGTYAGLTGNSHPYTGSGAEYAINYAGDAFSVCSIMTAAREIQGIANAHQVLSHEVAHTIGCGHSDTQDSQPGPQSATYSAALQFRLPEGKETMSPQTASITRDIMAYFGTTLMGYPTHIFYKDDGQGGREFMTRDEVKAMMGWTDDLENDVYYDNTDGSHGTGDQSCVWTYCYIVPYFSSPNLYFSTVTVPHGMELTDGVVTVYDQAQYDAMSAEDKAKLVPMGDETHNNRQVLIDNCQYASRWHLGVKFSKEGDASVVNGKSDKITLTPLSKNLTIYYTTDGTEPTKENGTLYTEPFSLTQAATVKVRSYDANGNEGDVFSKSYTMLPLATARGNTELTWTTTSPEWYSNNDVARSGNINSVAIFLDEYLSNSDIAFAEIPQSPIEINAYPINGAIVTNGTEMALSWDDPEVTVSYYIGENATETKYCDNEKPFKINFDDVAYTGNTTYHIIAEKSGKAVQVIGDASIKYWLAGNSFAPPNLSKILDTPDLFWAVSGDAWSKYTASPHKGVSAYKCSPNSDAEHSFKTIVNVDGDNKALTFYHKDNFVDENASFEVLVDDVQVWSTNGAITVQSDWVRSLVPIKSGSHTVEFRFTGNGSTLYLDAISIIGEKTTSTEDDAYPVPYSWFSIYDSSITDDKIEDRAKTKASNNLNTWWQCYVLGLDPTNETSKLVTTIRMDGTTPVVEYSPTNEVLKARKAIEYVLQGKPALSNNWQDVEFDKPGDTNRFFRIKVEWK